jgi:hypothetical protein
MAMKEHMNVHQTWVIHTVKHIGLGMGLDGINKRNWEEHLAVIHEVADKAKTTANSYQVEKSVKTSLG